MANKTEHHYSYLQYEGSLNEEVWIEFYALRFQEHEYLQPCRPEEPWKILHRCHYLMLPTVIFQGKCRSVHSNNRKGDNDMRKLFFKIRVCLGDR